MRSQPTRQLIWRLEVIYVRLTTDGRHSGKIHVPGSVEIGWEKEAVKSDRGKQMKR